MSSSADNHLADTASETYERELDEGLEEDAREQLREVEAALARIEAGEYGTCEVCGKEIPDERLEAVPWTTLCIDDARRQAALSEPARRELRRAPLDVRVGSSTNALRPISSASGRSPRGCASGSASARSPSRPSPPTS